MNCYWILTFPHNYIYFFQSTDAKCTIMLYIWELKISNVKKKPPSGNYWLGSMFPEDKCIQNCLWLKEWEKKSGRKRRGTSFSDYSVATAIKAARKTAGKTCFTDHSGTEVRLDHWTVTPVKLRWLSDSVTHFKDHKGGILMSIIPQKTIQDVLPIYPRMVSERYLYIIRSYNLLTCYLCTRLF